MRVRNDRALRCAEKVMVVSCVPSALRYFATEKPIDKNPVQSPPSESSAKPPPFET